MIERHGSSIRAGRLFAFESRLCDIASEPGGLPVGAMLFKGSRAGRREEMHEGRPPLPAPRAGALGAFPAPGEAS